MKTRMTMAAGGGHREYPCLLTYGDRVVLAESNSVGAIIHDDSGDRVGQTLRHCDFIGAGWRQITGKVTITFNAD